VARRPVVSAILAFLVDGAGHFALGHWTRGLIWNLADSVVILGLISVITAPAPRLFWPMFGLIALVRIAAMTDVIRLSRREGDVPAVWKVLVGVLALLVVANFELVWVRMTRVEAFKIPAGSMIPTLQVGDHIYVDKRGWTPARGEVVVFPYPREPDKDFVKRVIAIGGDTVRIDAGVPVVNGKAVDHRATGDCEYSDYDESSGQWETRHCRSFEETLDGHTYQVIEDSSGPTHSFQEVLVPPGAVYVMGDNRDNSHDSRFWGFVPADTVKGRVQFTWWSSGPDGVRWDRVGKLVQ
jgi:signal peptidase I